MPTMMRPTYRRRMATTTLAVIALLVPILPAAAEPIDAQSVGANSAAGGPTLQVLSSPRADRVSDGNVLLAVDRTGNRRPVVRLGDTDVSAGFELADGRWIGVVDGLVVGDNVITAQRAGSRGNVGTITVTNAPRTGPMFSGPQEQPYICRTVAFTTLAGTSMGEPQDADCSAPTLIEYVYRSNIDRSLKPLPDPGSRPDDLATTIISDGRTVPYIVRVETGVINRSIYEFAVLDDGAAPIDPQHGPSGWNQRMLYTFGSSCTRGWYTQGDGTGGIDDDWMLGQGYVVVSSTLNKSGNNCQPVTGAETMTMTKEHVLETIGVPVATIGIGCSGGSYQAFGIGDTYPGLLDGILVGCSFPEMTFGTLHTVTDARLLQKFFADHPGWTDAQKTAISGFGNPKSVNNLGNAGRRIDPLFYCPGELPEELRYDAQTNPGGARCDVYSHQLNIFGALPGSDGRLPLRPLDNVGIQYGLQALNSGAITVDEFLELNADIGGFDRDAKFVPERMVADRDAIDIAYSTGQMVNGARLGSVPIIDLREYRDMRPNGDLHQRFHSFSTRQRLIDTNGDAGNYVMWTEADGNGFTTENVHYRQAVTELDAWATRVDRMHQGTGTDLPRHRAVVAAKPRAVADACWSPEGQQVNEAQVPGIDNTRCNAWYPVWTSPRMVAGGPLANDVIACRLRDIDPADYPVPLTDEQLQTLEELFPDGVCDWSAPGIGQTGEVPAAWPVFSG